MELTVYTAADPIAALVLAHGAGAGARSPFMTRAAAGFASRGVTAVTFDFPYMAAGRRVPDAPAALEASWADALDEARARLGALPLFMGGKSMGGRIASHLAARRLQGVAGLVFLGYPLHPPGRPDRRRDAHLPAIDVPMLFVQGTRDAFGTAEEIRALLPRLARATLQEVPGGDHSFKVSGRPAPPAEESLSFVLDGARTWIARVAGVAPEAS